MGRRQRGRLTGRAEPPPTVDTYLARLNPSQRGLLQRLRRTIRKAAPNAKELISYGMPAFRQNGMLVYFGAFADHCSLFTGGTHRIRQLFSEDLKPFMSGRGTLKFSATHPLPTSLVIRIVKARVAENESRKRR